MHVNSLVFERREQYEENFIVDPRGGTAKQFRMPVALSRIEADSTPLVESVLRAIEESDGKDGEWAAVLLIARSILVSEELRQRAIRVL